jgi:hypothetical protein
MEPQPSKSFGYKPEIPINASSSLALAASLAKQTSDFNQERRLAAPILAVAVTTGKKWVQTHAQKRKKTEKTEEDDVIDQQLQASWIALQRKEREYEELKDRVSESEDEDGEIQASGKLVDFLLKHKPGGELDETDLVEVVFTRSFAYLYRSTSSEEHD